MMAVISVGLMICGWWCAVIFGHTVAEVARGDKSKAVAGVWMAFISLALLFAALVCAKLLGAK